MTNEEFEDLLIEYSIAAQEMAMSDHDKLHKQLCDAFNNVNIPGNNKNSQHPLHDITADWKLVRVHKIRGGGNGISGEFTVWEFGFAYLPNTNQSLLLQWAPWWPGAGDGCKWLLFTGVIKPGQTDFSIPNAPWRL